MKAFRRDEITIRVVMGLLGLVLGAVMGDSAFQSWRASEEAAEDAARAVLLAEVRAHPNNGGGASQTVSLAASPSAPAAGVGSSDSSSPSLSHHDAGLPEQGSVILMGGDPSPGVSATCRIDAGGVGSHVARVYFTITSEGVVRWEDLDPFNVAAVESAALEIPCEAPVIRALARLTREAKR